MESNDLSSNPFAGLFPNLELAAQYKALVETAPVISAEPSGKDPPDSPTPPPPDDQVKDVQELNNAIEEIFLVTLNRFSVISGAQSHLVFLSSLAEIIGTHNQAWIDMPTLEQALFERAMLENPSESIVSSPGKVFQSDSHLTETHLVKYLCRCFAKCNIVRNRSSTSESLASSIAQMKAMVVQNMATAFREPDLYVGQNLVEQIVEMLCSCFEVEPYLVEMLGMLADKLKEEEKESGVALENIFYPIFDQFKPRIDACSMLFFSNNNIVSLQYFVKNPILARLLILHSYPKPTQQNDLLPLLSMMQPNLQQPPTARQYENTLLGCIIAKSCLPKSDIYQSEFFTSPSTQPASVHSRTEGQIWSGLESVHSAGHTMINSLLRAGDDVKHLTLMWLGECLHANKGRGKMWTTQMGSHLAGGYVSDGFMLNLGAILLRFCGPLSGQGKMAKVDPTYCATTTVVSEDSRLSGVHLREMASATCLVTPDLGEGEEREHSPSFNFSTELFFMTHRTLDLGFRTVHEKFVKLNQELNQLQNSYRNAQAAGGGPAAEQVHERMDAAMTKYLTIKASLLEPATLEATSNFLSATAGWLVNLTTKSSSSNSSLSCVPEFLVENLCEHLLLVKRFCTSHFEQIGPKLADILDFILTFMAQPNYLKNPHLRARLAECLECLLPHHEMQGQPNGLGNFHREALFQDHASRLNIADAILHVFVSIEETGQSVQFEQKFSYRRPMYDVINYIWTLDEFKLKFRQMAEEAEAEIESETPPLFLRFVNLLINDAIFLLDEGLGYMKTLQEQEGEREGWNSLPAEERGANERQYNHTGQLARYHNLMGGETIGVLELLTGGITAIFSHPTMADRLAAMLNYFLKTLTGPERNNFRVKNFEKYSFKPGDVVAKICQIYKNLEKCPTFLEGVSNDGRSYSGDLFNWTHKVLEKINKFELASDMLEIAKKVAEKAAVLAVDEELLSNAPEAFLCPIMSCVMKDPVRLPASGVVVERSTIARHLLSDQSDPFNRAPLTMDMVEPDLELKERVDNWIKARRRGEDIEMEEEETGNAEPEKKKEKLEEVKLESMEVEIVKKSDDFDLD